MKYALLLRGINVGGKNKIAMSDLKICLEKLGFTEVSTLLNSGNAIFTGYEVDTKILSHKIEEAIIADPCFESPLVRVVLLAKNQLAAVIASAPKGFGNSPELYQSDVAFLIKGNSKEAIKQFECHPEVDVVWPGEGVIFYRRLRSKRTKSHLGKIIAKPLYKLLTIRTWETVNKLYARMNEV